jgi:hypothetical protein
MTCGSLPSAAQARERGPAGKRAGGRGPAELGQVGREAVWAAARVEAAGRAGERATDEPDNYCRLLQGW